MLKYIYTCVCIYTHAFLCLYICMYTCIHKYLRIYLSIYILIHLRIHIKESFPHIRVLSLPLTPSLSISLSLSFTVHTAPCAHDKWREKRNPLITCGVGSKTHTPRAAWVRSATRCNTHTLSRFRFFVSPSPRCHLLMNVSYPPPSLAFSLPLIY